MSSQKHQTVSDSPKGDKPALKLASKVLDLAQACAFLGISKPTMYAYLKQGIIPAFKYPGSRVWKFDQTQLEDWIKDQQEKGGRK